jgi:hypothetical protein
VEHLHEFAIDLGDKHQSSILDEPRFERFEATAG